MHLTHRYQPSNIFYMKTHRKALRTTFLIASSIAGLVTPSFAMDMDHTHHDPMPHMAFESVHQLVSQLSPTQGNQATGTILFESMDDGKVKITGKISGLTPNAKHAIHIHEYGDVRATNGTMTGGHYNPENHDHALPEMEMRHAGDMGNLEADSEGVASLSLVVDNVSLVGTKNPIIGRGVIVHAGEDDGGQPTGNAGARIAQGVIGIAKQ